MKLFYAYHEKHIDVWGIYVVENTDELMQVLATEVEKDKDYIRNNFIYSELSHFTNNVTGKKYKVVLEEL
ncbi:hypothetical protein GRF59_14925 [Paenibacillus sp. HJL G12]|uniref:Uncharacterized protein n=1 Tax=Paenibacillus dendrobii TaxID=2691084 RepID=A0A7X3IJ31_9BACL|nr:hypothetical protein [Paenibacillus dendrobii]MWV44913.1 hypothetical protein [Paenibacillus dendrobii]